MPPRFSYWTILAGGMPTSFRAAERDDLLPTFRRLQERHPDAEMKWFQRGRLWESPEAAQSEFQKTTPPRGRDWRPGGEHRDPREPFKKAKREHNQKVRQQRFARKNAGPGPVRGEPERQKPYAGKRTGTDRPRTDRPRAPIVQGRIVQEQIARKRIAQERITPGPDALRHVRRPKEGAADDPSPGPVQTAGVAE